MSDITPKTNSLQKYFLNPKSTCHRQYEALRAFFCDNTKANVVANNFGYRLNAFYSLIKEFKERMIENATENLFFKTNKPGRKERNNQEEIDKLIIILRKQYLSIPEIKTVLEVQKHNVSHGYIWSVLRKEQFARLPRRDNKSREETQANAKDKIEAPQSEKLSL